MCWGTTHFWEILLGYSTFLGYFVGARHIFEKFENVLQPVGRFIYDRSLIRGVIHLLERRTRFLLKQWYFTWDSW